MNEKFFEICNDLLLEGFNENNKNLNTIASSPFV